MRATRREGFLLSNNAVRRDILIPRYYDPRIEQELDDLASGYHLISLDALVDAGQLAHDHGNYIPKIYYGTGPFPYIRTSDLANWEIKASPKHGVPESVYEAYVERQAVQPQDILFAHEGTYLIGTVAMVTAFDGPMLYQHHLAKFRIKPDAPFNAYFLLAALETEIVQRQIRSKQFSADIIDSVVGRLGEVIIPFPKDTQKLREVEARVERIVLGRAEARERISHITPALDGWLRTENAESLTDIFAWRPNPEVYQGKPAFLGGRNGFLAFMRQSGTLKHDVLLPKYYDPVVSEMASQYSDRCELVTIQELAARGLVQLQTGDEIGRLAYGTGPIPFVRTSDFASWELKRESKQGVSQDIFDIWHDRQDVQGNDILLVRDGTYLVGTSVLVQEHELPLLYCGGIIKLRCTTPDVLHAVLLFALLNLPFVQRQMRNKQFTRDVIDTLGRRLGEVVVPLPLDEGIRHEVVEQLGGLLDQRGKLQVELREVIATVFTHPEHATA